MLGCIEVIVKIVVFDESSPLKMQISQAHMAERKEYEFWEGCTDCNSSKLSREPSEPRSWEGGKQDLECLPCARHCSSPQFYKIVFNSYLNNNKKSEILITANICQFLITMNSRYCIPRVS